MVEYLNQINLKGDLVLDELKRVSAERDSFKYQLADAEKSTKAAWDEVAKLRELKESMIKTDDSSKADSVGADVDTKTQDVYAVDPVGATSRTTSEAIKLPDSSARSSSLYSLKPRSTEPQSQEQGSEELFSYDEEIPRLETELQDRHSKIDGLEAELGSLKADLLVTREPTQSMVQSLEEATRELNGLRDIKDRAGEEKLEFEKLSGHLQTELSAVQDRLLGLQGERNLHEATRISELESQLQAARGELDSTRIGIQRDTETQEHIDNLQSTITTLKAEVQDKWAGNEQTEKKIETLNKLVATLRFQLKETDEKNLDLKIAIDKSSKAYTLQQEKLAALEAQGSGANPDQPNRLGLVAPQTVENGATQNHEASHTTKKKAKRKKKTAKSSAENEDVVQAGVDVDPDAKVPKGNDLQKLDTVIKLQEELRQLRNVLDEKDAAIERMHSKLKDQDGLREEIEILRDDLVNVGQEHVEAKDRIKDLVADKATLETKVADLEKELARLQSLHQAHTVSSEQKHNDLTAQFEDLKTKSNLLQIDLLAAQQLASSRFKDLNDLRGVLQKAQPEINVLRSEAGEVKSIKDALTKKEAELKRLDSRHEEMRSEVAGLNKTCAERELEMKTINRKLAQESTGRLKAEENVSKTTDQIQRLETEKRYATESLDRLTKELEEARQEIASGRLSLANLEERFSKIKSENEGLKEELDLKTAQYASAQSLMASMRDQTTEMAMQTKEARERCESLDEEVADAHRLLGERSREGETMRRLLANVEERADARTREMKERMDAAIEERDRAEDEASTTGRRRARELEDLRNKCREAERNMKRAEEEKEELEHAQRDWKRRREELEHQANRSTREADEIQTAMRELRDALDESERQARELEKQKAELRRSVEESQYRLEKLQKSNKVGAFGAWN